MRNTKRALIVRDKEIFPVDENSQVLSQIKIRYVAIGENNLMPHKK
jgi:hypothetical protein